jgi:hypothetical protein
MAGTIHAAAARHAARISVNKNNLMITKSLLVAATILEVAAPHRLRAQFDPRVPPAYAKNLNVIYEINPRGYTSPNGVGDGNGSGTSASLQAKMAYLQDLGINGIWLAGYCLATNHFYNIWSVYGDIRPDMLDPALGSAAEFQSLINEAHSRGIKVFLDVITHGVVNESDLIVQHPNFFSGGSWEMTDYNYTNQEFIAWWTNLWTSYVVAYGVDGYRLDCGFTPGGSLAVSAWDQIVINCHNAGHDVTVFPEGYRYHFSQNDNADWSITANQIYTRQLSCHDNGWQSVAGNYYTARGSRCRLGYDQIFSPNITVAFGGEEFDAQQVSLPNLCANLYTSSGCGGSGGWLYGQQMQWSDLDSAAHLAVYNDTRKMLAIKNANRDVLSSDRWTAGYLVLSGTAGTTPYARYLYGRKAIVVAGNYSTNSAVTNTIAIPLATMGLGGCSYYKLTDLWNNTTSVISAASVSNYSVTIGADKTPGGGIAVFKIEGGNTPALSKFNGSSWLRQGTVDAVKVSVDTNGYPWIVDSQGDVLQYNGASWTTRMSGGAADMGCGADGTVAVIGIDQSIETWTGSGWTQIPGSGTAIAVDRGGSLWVVNSVGEVWQYAGSSWTKRKTSGAADVGCGADGTVAIIGTDQSIKTWAGSGWSSVSGLGVRIAVNNNGDLWVVNASGEVWQRASASWTLRKSAGHTWDIGANRNEYIAIAAPVVPVLQASVTGNLVRLSWPSTPKQMYQVQCCTNLSEWQDLGSPVAATTNFVLSSSDFTVFRQRFYRVLLTGQ